MKKCIAAVSIVFLLMAGSLSAETIVYTGAGPWESQWVTIPSLGYNNYVVVPEKVSSATDGAEFQ